MVLMSMHDMNRGKAPMLKMYVGVGAPPPLASLRSGYVLLLLRSQTIFLRFGHGLFLVLIVSEAS